MINTVPDDCSCRTYFCCFPLTLANTFPGPFLPILSNFCEKKRTRNHPQCLSGLSRALFPTAFLGIAVYDFHIFITSSSSFHRFITNQFNDLLPVGLLAQLVRALHRYRRGQGCESCTSLNFFRLSFCNCKSGIYNCDDLISYTVSVLIGYIYECFFFQQEIFL